ncbi:Crp cAMP-binding proteins - catabolite gene activator and regulatory subunit of cAMP-dependent protein kinases [uncultured Caudovirales phage]|uniref:Crp cAMP-binding proteins - catabolite gene activator and regulatory subunit of cAMP-dependent protein kinases n=1 Tax=uncultured Caudovirales phage TaxID=2100421 RepID=A0A6J5RKH2_9CAUD|nr:Crp cAMP-binding proteins - catabolite gene activator and regulatory subunit of cAMP-dependent protein kinases [uncultured Caudovirales phage]
MGERTTYDITDIPLFKDIGEAIVGPLRHSCLWRKVQEGEFIVRLGEKDRYVLFLVKGSAHKKRVLQCGTQVGLGRVDEGSFFGEEFDGNEVMYDVVATSDSVVMAMPNETFDLAVGYSTILARVGEKLINEVRSLYRKLDLLAIWPKEQRIEAEIRSLSVGGVVEMPPHEQLAAEVMCSRETIARTISQLVRTGRMFLLSTFPRKGYPGKSYKLSR